MASSTHERSQRLQVAASLISKFNMMIIPVRIIECVPLLAMVLVAALGLKVGRTYLPLHVRPYRGRCARDLLELRVSRAGPAEPPP